MASLEFAGDSGSLSDINATQGEFRAQIAALNDMMRQIAGNAAISAGDSAQADPLSAPFTLYVNPYTGSDEFVGGAYNDYEEGVTQAEIIASKLKRLEKQRLTCGFTPQRPFKTINRAVIEAAIITSKDWYTITDPAAHVDCVSIVLSTGVHTLYNDPGQASTSIASWGISKDPTTADLIEFNPATVGGVLLPRGCSLCGPDLRKTTIRPNWVPAVVDEAADYSNRRGMLKITGTGYFFGFTFMDKIGLAASHHLLDAFQFASKAELDDFYAKTFSAVGSGADLGSALTVTRGTEYQIVGPIDRTQAPTSAWDTTASASPYIFNCSIRSDYGIGGAFMDGSKVEGLKSMVCANFTGVSLQKDMSCWQRYSGTTWSAPTYEQYINTDPDYIRMNPARLSRHISAINDAFIQEVSVFAIGQGVHHFTDLGGEITVTNSNSSFGGCAAISKGYKSFPFPQDENWSVGNIRVPLNVSEKTGNVKRIYLGTISAISSSKITLDTALATTEESSTIPLILYNQDYSLRNGTRVWVENPTGNDWRASLTSSAWSSSVADEINISAQLLEAETDATVGTDDEGASLAIGKRVYIRRLVDTRTPNERRVSLKLNNTGSTRLPQRNFVLQTDPNRSGGAISRELTGESETLIVLSSGAGDTPGAGVTKTSEITLRRAAPTVIYTSGQFYPAGAVVRHNNKHFQALESQTASGADPDPDKWGETFVHMASDYNAEDSSTNNELIVVFDTDTSDAPASTTLGINFATVWTTLSDDYAVAVRNRYRTSTDYLGVYALLIALGFSSSEAHAALVPQAAADRDLDPTSATDFPDAPSGGAATGRGNWAVEFRRPSTLRLYGHAWEWAGFLNYSKAIPAAQQELGPQNKFTYYFTNEAGGRVVPQGSNEDGFNITPRGLEDIETGATLTVESIGTSSIDDSQQTEFDELTVNGTATINDLVVSNTIDFPDTATAKTDRLGIGYLARQSDIESGSITSTDGDIDNADPRLVTVGALEYWKQYNALLSRRSGTTVLYCVPDDAVNGGTYSFDGTSATILADPDRSGDAIINDPPTSTARATRLSRAAAYANSVFSEFETVEYRLANGPYWEFSVTFNHIANVYGAESQFPGDDAVTADFTSSPAKTPSTDVKTLIDARPFVMPVFRIGTNFGFASNGVDVSVVSYPASLRFEKGGFVGYIGWLGAEDTYADANFPDSIFGSGIQAARASSANLLDAIDDYLPSTGRTNLNLYTGYPNISVRDATLSINSCIFGAKSPGFGSYGYGRFGEAVGAIGDCTIIMGGIYILGNINSVGKFEDCKAAGMNVVNSEGIANSQLFVRNSSGGKLNVFFSYTFSYDASGASFKRDLNRNCVHILDNNGNYALKANRLATDGTRGAAFNSFIGQNQVGTEVYTGAFTSWQRGFTTAGHQPGFAGAFGNRNSNTFGPYGIQPENARNYFRLPAYNNKVWQVAKSGAELATSGSVTFPGGAVTAGSFVEGRRYQILSLGDTDFTTNGAPANAVGVEFVALGAGTGTGTALPLYRGEAHQSCDDSDDNDLNIRTHVFFQGINAANVRTVGSDFYG